MSYVNGSPNYLPNSNRYDHMQYRRCGNSGLKLPLLSLGLWHNFGGYDSFENGRDIIRKAFDLGITHIDLANNYGPPPGSAEENFGRILSSDFHCHRDEMIISSKAGYYMWPGPYGEWGSKKYLIASLDQSLKRMGLDYVDIFYSHRFDPETPLEETMGALDLIVRQGKALYVGISSYGPKNTLKALEILSELGTPCLIHQSSYSMLNRWVEDKLLDILGQQGVGLIAFSPLAQGMLSDKYLHGIPDNSRVTKESSLNKNLLSENNLANIASLNEIAQKRGQTLAQMAITWILRDKRVVSVLMGASSPEQVEENVNAIHNLDFSRKELEEIDNYAVEGDINLWAQSSNHG
ncbi:MAG: L-glyceraldehyde 3-phosphate reductase [Chloroflexota bacterium]|nr:L-glyceraldehyde 3-phosphate reductase [Chloroflexota bacterium]